MDVVSPFSLLEVTMNEEINADDDDCIIIEDNEETPNSSKGNASNALPVEERMEVEVDPLFLSPSLIYSDKQSNMPTLWVTTNITNLATVPLTESAFRKTQYSNLYEVLTEILHCTICLEHVGCDMRIHPSSIEHPVLRVLICEQCACSYKTINFILNEKGKEVNCRWCGKGSYGAGPSLRTCQQCPFSFCELCLRNNCPDYFDHEPHFPWTCVVCNMRVLWPARASLWALHCLKSLLLANPGNELAKINGDISLCCKNRKKKKKVVVDALQTLGSSGSFDLDNLVPPHLLNGSSEADLYQSQLPLPVFPDLVKSYSVSPKINLKPKAKPRPRPRAKPKPKTKPKNDVTFPASVPVLVSSEQHQETIIQTPSENSNRKPHWLRQKLIGYINDFDQLRAKLEDIEKSLDFEEFDPQTEEKVDTITTLLSLHKELLNSCRLSLINEWKERKARTVLENYNPKTEEETEIRNETLPNVVESKVQRTKVTKSSSKKKKYNKSINNLKQFAKVKFQENGYPSIKDCFVKLEKLEMPLLNFNNQSFIKQDKKDVQ